MNRPDGSMREGVVEAFRDHCERKWERLDHDFENIDVKVEVKGEY